MNTCIMKLDIAVHNRTFIMNSPPRNGNLVSRGYHPKNIPPYSPVPPSTKYPVNRVIKKPAVNEETSVLLLNLNICFTSDGTIHIIYLSVQMPENLLPSYRHRRNEVPRMLHQL